LLAAEGRRVGVVDADTKTPSLHFMFGLDEDQISCSFFDFLKGDCKLDRTVVSLAGKLAQPPTGALFYVPGSANPTDFSDWSDYLEQVDRGCRQLVGTLNLDILLIDTQAGLSQQALLSLTLPDVLVLVLHPDFRDFQGTGITVDVVRQLEIPRVGLIVNEVPAKLDFDALRADLIEAYGCEVMALLPHADEMMTLTGQKIFAMHYPHHPLTAQLHQAAIDLAT
jgi:MinD-like ATPase involved in chromosome partitioning or flagellar assembly